MDIYLQTLTELSKGLENGDFTSVEITKLFLERIAAQDERLNSFITVTASEALESAANADKARLDGKAGVLNGLPIAHKDIFCTQGIKTTCGSKMLNNFISPYDATIVKKISDAGAVILGKCNMDEFAMGSSNETSFFGPVYNPWNLECTPGGSSGGSAASVAARLTPVSTGTDTGGSIRQPAAFTGTVGLKPTYGRVSRYGMIAFASSLDQAGIITRSVEDSAKMLGVIAGFDRRDSTSINCRVPNYLLDLNESIKGMRIGIVRQHFENGSDEKTLNLVQDAISELKSLGALITEIDLPNIDLSVPAYYVVAPAECSSNLSRFDGVRFGYRAENPKDLHDLYCRSRGEGFGDEVKRRIMTGAYVLSAGYYDAYYVKAQQVRQLIAEDFQKAFSSVDLIAGPTTPSPAFKIGEKLDDPIKMYLNDIFTIGANLAGLPAMSIPCGFVDDLPVGLQLVGPHFGEQILLRCGHQYQEVTAWHKACPEAFK
tara:strand:+ start:727 stop:2187 length:1461 start_codon:yes stop_codon:yes gene_type:complete